MWEKYIILSLYLKRVKCSCGDTSVAWQEEGSAAVSRSEAVKALSTVIRYVKQIDPFSPDVALLVKLYKTTLAAQDTGY